MQKFIALFERNQREESEVVVQKLTEAGFSLRDIAVVTNLRALWSQLGCRPARFVYKDVAIGVGYGTLGAGLFGVLAAAGQLVAGFSPTVALDTLIGFILIWGVVVGGFLGFFFGLGDSEEETRQFMRGILRGGTIVALRANDEEIPRAHDLLNTTGARAVKIFGYSDAKQHQHLAAHPVYDRLTMWARRVARGLGSALLILMLLFFVGEGIFGAEPLSPLRMSLLENFMLLTLVMTLIGIVVAFYWEGIGGLIIIGSAMLFVGINTISSGDFRVGVLEFLFTLTGLFFLFDWWRIVGVDLSQNRAQTAQS